MEPQFRFEKAGREFGEDLTNRLPSLLAQKRFSPEKEPDDKPTYELISKNFDMPYIDQIFDYLDKTEVTFLLRVYGVIYRKS